MTGWHTPPSPTAGPDAIPWKPAASAAGPGQASPFAPPAAPATATPDARTGPAAGPITTAPFSTPARHDPALCDPAPHGPAPQDPALHMTAGGGPDSLTAAGPVGAEADDLGETRVRPAAAGARPSPAFDDGTTEVARSVVVIGRNPAGYDGEMIEYLVPIRDSNRSVSGTHLQVRAAGEDLCVTDSNSTNGSTGTNAAGQESELQGRTPSLADVGAAVHVGDRSFRVDRA